MKEKYHDIQLKCIDILPDDETEAIDAVAALIANMIISMNKNIDDVYEVIGKHYRDYLDNENNFKKKQ